MNLKHQAPRGTRDLMPGETERWQWAEDLARGVLERYGYREIRTPAFEDYELFARTAGEATDVVQKEMYRFRDLKGRDLALRPEGTASVARALLEHGQVPPGRVHRLWYMGPMFRYGRPQKGRLRQFHQLGAEIVGTAAPAADVEAIALFVDLFAAWGISGLTVAVNSVGTPDSRRDYAARLVAWLAPARDRLSAESRQRLEANPLRVLDSKDPHDRALLAGEDERLGPPPRLLDALDAEARARFDAVCAGLADLGIAHEIDHGLVRGLDYYTHTAFEVHDRSLGAQSALGGGGRYDGLFAELGGAPVPGVGFSIGLDRTLLVLGERDAAPGARPPSLYVVAMDGTRRVAPVLARALRQAYVVELDLEARAVGAQLKAAGRAGAAVAVLLGEEEWGRGEVILKNLKTGVQQTARLEDCPALLDELLAPAGAGPGAT